MTTPVTPGSVPVRTAIELEQEITVYPARTAGGRWRAVWYEDGERRQCEGATEDKLAGKLEKVIERLAADASNMKHPGAQLISWYLNPDRLPVERRWSRRHADTQRRLCERFVVPIIDTVACQDIKPRHIQAIVNAAPTAGEGDRVRRTVSAMISAGLDSGYLADPRLAKVHWQPGDRQLALERSQRLGHMTGASWFFVSLARHAREGGGELAEWLTEAETVTGFNHAAGSAGIGSRFSHPTGRAPGPKMTVRCGSY